MKKNIILVILSISSLFLTFADEAQEIEKQGFEILNISDQRFYRYEGTSRGIVSRVDMLGHEITHEIEIYKRGVDKLTIVWTAPSINRNDIALREGDIMYFKPAKFKKPQKMSYQQMFLESEFSWEDIMTSDTAYNYFVTDIQDLAGENMWKLELEPKVESLHSKIEVWIDKTNYNMLKRVYYTASGAIMKEAEYHDFKEVDGKIVSFSIRLKDEFMGTSSSATIYDIEEVAIDDFYFDPLNINEIKAKN